VDLVVFGDDWGAHPSTTQHLIRAWPDARVIWVNSLGMRAPAPTLSDLRRAVGKLRQGGRAWGANRSATPSTLSVVEPRVLPFHSHGIARAFNRVSLGAALRRASHAAGMERPHVLVANPVAAYYLDTFRHARVAYLRLDNYPLLPGVDGHLARDAEARLQRSADACFATAETLIPEQPRQGLWHTLAQGVDMEHFAPRSFDPPDTRVLGFFGLLAEWVDYDLIRQVARDHPDWTLELRGPVRHLPEDLRSISNVRVLPPVPYADLPSVIGHWRAAWLPFLCNELTQGVNPLKLREYLAAGLPTLSTPLPAARDLRDVCSVTTSTEVGACLRQIIDSDDAGQRRGRRDAMFAHSWSARSSQLRAQWLSPRGSAANAVQCGTSDRALVSV